MKICMNLVPDLYLIYHSCDVALTHVDLSM